MICRLRHPHHVATQVLHCLRVGERSNLEGLDLDPVVQGLNLLFLLFEGGEEILVLPDELLGLVGVALDLVFEVVV